MKLQKIKKLSVLYRKLKAESCRLAEKLGFVKENGEVKLPCYNNFWVFMKVRLVGERIDQISEKILPELKDELRLRGVEFGKNTAHEKDDFVVNAEIDYKLSLLLKYGRIEEVGYYYRDRYVQEYLNDKDVYEKEYHKRSLEEAANNLIKNGLVDTENASNGTGLRNRGLHVKLCFLAMQSAALIRAQHGRTNGLTSVENLAC